MNENIIKQVSGRDRDTQIKKQAFVMAEPIQESEPKYWFRIIL